MKRNYLLLEDLEAIAIWTLNAENEHIYFRVEYLDGKKGFGDWLCCDPSYPKYKLHDEVQNFVALTMHKNPDDMVWCELSREEAMLMLGM